MKVFVMSLLLFYCSFGMYLNEDTKRKRCNEPDPIYNAAMCGNTEIVESLAKQGYDLDLADANGRTPIYIAAEKGHKKVVEFLAAQNDVDLNQAAFGYFIVPEKASDLPKSSFPWEICQKFGTQTPLHVAARNGDKEIVEYLVRHGADLNLTDVLGHTPIHVAVLKGHKETVEYLARQGADVNQADDDGHTPIHAAALFGYKEIIESLAKHGADLDPVDDDEGHTPIYYAATEGRTEVVNLLIDKKVKLEENLLGIAATEEIKQIITNALKNRLDVVDSFAEKVDVSAVVEIEQSPIWIAVKEGRLNDVEFLAAENVDLNQANYYGRNLVFWAAMFGRTEVVKFLARKNVNLDQADHKGHTPLYIAVWYSHTDIVNFLISKKVKLEEKLLEIAEKEKIKQIITKALKKLDNSTKLGDKK